MQEMETVSGVQIPEGLDVFYFMLMPLEKAFIYILLPAMGKYLGRLSFLSLIRQIVKQKNSKIKPAVLRSEIDFILHPAHYGGLN